MFAAVSGRGGYGAVVGGSGGEGSGGEGGTREAEGGGGERRDGRTDGGREVGRMGGRQGGQQIVEEVERYGWECARPARTPSQPRRRFQRHRPPQSRSRRTAVTANRGHGDSALTVTRDHGDSAVAVTVTRGHGDPFRPPLPLAHAPPRPPPSLMRAHSMNPTPRLPSPPQALAKAPYQVRRLPAIITIVIVAVAVVVMHAMITATMTHQQEK